MTLNKTLKLSIVIPTLGRSKTLVKLLESLQSQKISDPFEVLLVDNSLDKNIFSELQALSSRFRIPIQIVSSEKRGVNYARNLGICKSNGQIILFIDDDCWMEDRMLLSKHILLHEKYPDFFGIGGYYSLDLDGGFIDSCYHQIQMDWLSRSLISSEDNECRYLIGGHFSVKVDPLRQNEIFFDEKIIYGGSELSLFNQAININLKIRLEKLFLVHNPKLTFFSLVKKQYMQGRGKAYLADNQSHAFEHYENSDKLDLKSRVVIYFSQMAFWTGFYFQQKKYFSIISHVLKQWTGELKRKKFEIQKRIDDEIKDKKNRGDRF